MDLFKFFDWIRENVKNSVLFGLNDAANAMGATPEETGAGKDRILSLLRNNADGEAPVRRIAGSPASGTKKLGRSLNDIAAKEAS